MGQEDEADDSARRSQGFTVDDALLGRAAADAVVLHCLPAHRGEEISDEVIDGPEPRSGSKAANRMHAMRGLLAWVVRRARAQTVQAKR